MSDNTDVIIIGAGAAGLMCAIEAAKRGRRVVILEHNRKPGNKIRMSGGGKCNFTNYFVSAENFISHNPHFCKSALSRFTQWDFLAMIERYKIPFHERDHGQLFCSETSKDILDMLLTECQNNGVDIHVKCVVSDVRQHAPRHFSVNTSRGTMYCQSLVIATGGLSIPTTGATPFGYRVAEQFGIHVWPTSAGLVPLTLHQHDKDKFSQLSGIAIDAIVSNARSSFRENILFTHRGLSGPAILQISSYWLPGESITINLLPETSLDPELDMARRLNPDVQLKTLIAQFLPKRVVSSLIDENIAATPIKRITEAQFANIKDQLQHWSILPNGTEGYRTAEVTLGGVDCDAISSKTMECHSINGLYFIGEVVDVTGWLGGYNLQWAWSSGWCAGQYV